jgi:hypothetical protein
LVYWKDAFVIVVVSSSEGLNVILEDGLFELVERRHGLARVMVVGKYSVTWLQKAVEKM